MDAILPHPLSESQDLLSATLKLDFERAALERLHPGDALRGGGPDAPHAVRLGAQ